MSDSLYTYCLLKYKHSPFLDESINIGVLIYFKNSHRFVFKYSKTLNRIRTIYDKIPDRTIKEYIRQIDRILIQYQSKSVNVFPLNDLTLKKFVYSVLLPNDSTVLQFSHFKTEPTRGFSEELIESIILDQYFVDDIKSPSYIPQEPKIISHFYKELERFHYKEIGNASRYQKDFNISTETAKFSFDFAWKNGVWNLVKPVGFDLKTAEGIIEKAHKNLGQFTDLETQLDKKDYKCNLIVGKPSERKFFKNYDSALKILHKLKSTEIIEENDLRDYSEKVISAIAEN